MSTSLTGTAGKPIQTDWWTPGDWHAFFGFGTNILVQHAFGADCGPCVELSCAEYARLRCVRAPASCRARLMMLPLHLLLCVAAYCCREYRPYRRCSLPSRRQRAARVHRHLRDHVADTIKTGDSG